MSAELAATIESLLPGPAVLVGRLPPAGRDLDLLVAPDDVGVLEDALRRAGFRARGGAFVRLRDCTADVVELLPADGWLVPPGEVARLFEDAVPLLPEDGRRLRRPAPGDEVLILARRAAAGGAAAEGRLRERLSAVLREEPHALETARHRAAAWGAEAALRRLERGRPASLPDLARARGVRRPRRGALITLSGLDGAGKSSHAAALQDTLHRLGYDPVVRWTSLSQHPPLLHALTRAAAWVLGHGQPRGAAGPEGPAGAPTATAAARARSRALTHAWAGIVALSNAVEQLRATRLDLWLGRVVICDRYTLDSAAHLRYAYGEDRRFRAQVALLRVLSPRPALALLLDVPPEEASRRNADFPLAENRRRARLYREEAARHGAAVVDGTRPRAAVCADVAERVLDALAGRG